MPVSNLPINTLSNGIINPTITKNLLAVQTFTLSNNLKSLIMVNTSSTEVVNILVKGTRSSINLAAYGPLDITDGVPLSVSAKGVCTLALQLMYKHFGENGDAVDVSSSSPGNADIVCWLSE